MIKKKRETAKLRSGLPDCFGSVSMFAPGGPRDHDRGPKPCGVSVFVSFFTYSDGGYNELLCAADI